MLSSEYDSRHWNHLQRLTMKRSSHKTVPPNGRSKVSTTIDSALICYILWQARFVNKKQKKMNFQNDNLTNCYFIVISRNFLMKMLTEGETRNLSRNIFSPFCLCLICQSSNEGKKTRRIHFSSQQKLGGKWFSEEMFCLLKEKNNSEEKLFKAKEIPRKF